MSDSSVTTDFVVKNAEYRATPSVQRYVVLQQTKPAAAVFSRKGDNWITDLLAGNDALLRMPEIDLDIPLRKSIAVSSLNLILVKVRPNAFCNRCDVLGTGLPGAKTR